MKKVLPMLALVFLLCVTAACGSGTVIEKQGETTIIQNVTGKPADRKDPKEVAFALAGKLAEYQTWQVDTTGTTEAYKIIHYTQQIENTAIKNGDEHFAESVSTSSMVNINVTHQAFVKGEKVVYRDAREGDLTVAVRSDYQEIYGVLPGVDSLGGWALNKDSIRFAERVTDKCSEGVNVYRFVLDNEKATSMMKRQMTRFGGLSGAPEFSSVELLVTLKDDWTPVSIESSSTYTVGIPILGKADCTQNLKAVFSKINENVEIPDSAAFNEAIGETPTEIDPGKIPQTDENLEGLVQAMLGYDLAGGVELRGNSAFRFGATHLNLPLTANVGFDFLDFAASGVQGALKAGLSTNVLGTELSLYYLDGTIYLGVGSAKSALPLNLPATTAGGAEADLADFVVVTALENGAGYRVGLSDQVVDLVNGLLVGVDLSLDELNIDFMLSPVADSQRVSSIVLEANFNGGAYGLRADMIVNDRTFPEIAVEQYAERSLTDLMISSGAAADLIGDFAGCDWTQGKTINVVFDVNMLYKDFTVPIALTVRSAPAPQLKAHIDLTHEGANYMLQLVTLGGPGLFPKIPDYIDLYYADGKLYTAMGTNGAEGPVDFKVGVSDLGAGLDGQLESLIGGLLLNLDSDAALRVVEQFVFGMVPTVTETGIVLNGDAGVVALVDEGYQQLLALITRLATENAGPMGGMIGILIGFNPNGLAVAIDREQSGALGELRVDVDGPVRKKTDKDKPYIFRLSLSFGDDPSEETFRTMAAKTAEIDAATAAIDGLTAEIADLTAQEGLGEFVFVNFHLGDAYLARIEAVEAAYEALSAAHRALVYNYDLFGDYKAQFEAERNAALAFAAALYAENPDFEELHNQYGKMTAAQYEYLGPVNDIFVKAFETYQVEVAAPAVKEEYAAAATAVPAADTTAKLQKVFATLTVLNARYDALCEDAKAVVDNRAETLAACDARMAELLDAEAKTLLDQMNADLAEGAQPTAEGVLATYEAFGALKGRTVCFFADGAATVTGLKNYQDALKLYEKEYHALWSGFRATDLAEELAALKETYLNAATLTETESYFERLSELRAVYLTLTEDAQKAVTGYADVLAHYDQHWVTALDAECAALRTLMQEYLDAAAAGNRPEQADVEACAARVAAAKEAYKHYFDFANRSKLTEYNTFNRLSYDFLDFAETYAAE